MDKARTIGSVGLFRIYISIVFDLDDIKLIEDLRLRISSELKNEDDIPPTYILFRWLKATQVVWI